MQVQTLESSVQNLSSSTKYMHRGWGHIFLLFHPNAAI
jgi:hypothetical protein